VQDHRELPIETRTSKWSLHDASPAKKVKKEEKTPQKVAEKPQTQGGISTRRGGKPEKTTEKKPKDESDEDNHN